VGRGWGGGGGYSLAGGGVRGGGGGDVQLPRILTSFPEVELIYGETLYERQIGSVERRRCVEKRRTEDSFQEHCDDILRGEC